MTRRTRRGVAGSVLIVLGLVIGAVIATARRPRAGSVKADTNDGGAWLLKRDGATSVTSTGVGEITAAVSVSEPGPTSTSIKPRTCRGARRPGHGAVVDDSSNGSPTRPACGRLRHQVHAVDGGP
jgi:hypothetical protein